MLKRIARAFKMVKAPRNPTLSIDPEVGRRIVASRSHGNVRLQAGLFYTKSDVDAEYERLRGTEFAAD